VEFVKKETCQIQHELEQLELEKKLWKEQQDKIEKYHLQEKILLNVGGTMFSTTKEILRGAERVNLWGQH